MAGEGFRNDVPFRRPDRTSVASPLPVGDSEHTDVGGVEWRLNGGQELGILRVRSTGVTPLLNIGGGSESIAATGSEHGASATPAEWELTRACEGFTAMVMNIEDQAAVVN